MARSTATITAHTIVGNKSISWGGYALAGKPHGVQHVNTGIKRVEVFFVAPNKKTWADGNASTCTVALDISSAKAYGGADAGYAFDGNSQSTVSVHGPDRHAGRWLAIGEGWGWHKNATTTVY